MNSIITDTYKMDRDYSGTILFLNELMKINPLLLWESGRMNFWRSSVHGGKKNDDPFFRENVKIWKSEDRIVCLFISEYGGDDFFIAVHPDFSNALPEVFAWINVEWAGEKEQIYTEVFSDDREAIGLLERNGYTFAEHTENRRFYNSETADLDYSLPDGYLIKTFDEYPNYESRVAVVKSAFDNEDYSRKNLDSIHSSPEYIKDLDLLVVGPDGEIAAYCIGWRDQVNPAAGYIEPVGTHEEHRRRGLASALIKECFKRQKNMGISCIDISSKAEPDPSNYLYDSLGPEKKLKMMRYKKAVK